MALTTSEVEIPTPDGVMPGHLALPEGGGPFPAVIVIMEAFGLVPHIKAVTERIAGEGYAALAPDFYYRMLPANKVGYDELPKAIGLMQQVDDERFLADMGAALDFLSAQPGVDGGPAGVTGFCMGGRLTFLSACALPDRVRAAAPFYGGGTVGHLDRADALRAPLLLFFGEADPYIPMDQVRAIDAKLSELGKTYTLKTYPGADHGFFCDERPSYAADAASDAWERLTAFFAQHLR